jgi:glycosyltransferase involved in cell wall biosynthesis
MKVVLAVGGFPSEENPHHGVFNKRSADLLAKEVDLEVVQFRFWKPGRSFYELNQENNYSLHILCPKQIPVKPYLFFCLNAKIQQSAFARVFKQKIKEADVLHSVSGLLGLALSPAAKYLGLANVCQLIGSDINSEFPLIQYKSCFNNRYDAIDAFGCNSKALENELANYKDKPRKVIYRGIDCQKNQRNQKIPRSNAFLYVGGMPNYPFGTGRNVKGGRTLMKAWQEYEFSFHTAGWSLTFAGPDANIEEVQSWHAKLKHPERVIIKGKLPFNQVVEEMNKASVMLVPSLEEGLPNVAMEAMARELAVIGTRVGGIPELIKDKHSGFLIEAGNHHQLADIMLNLAENRTSSKLIGANARKEMLHHFDSKKFSQDYVRFYKDILAS